MLKRFVVITALVASLISTIEMPVTHAATVVASSTNADVCNQAVSISSGITAQRSVRVSSRSGQR
jgi:hypothetical protein